MAAQSAKVLAFPERIRIVTRQQALDYGDAWQYQCHRMEVALYLAEQQLAASDLLLRLCEEERDKLKALLG